MQMLYNSDCFVVVQFDPPTESSGAEGSAEGSRGGYEIVDKMSRKEIYLRGAVAQSFQRGVEALVQQGPDHALLDEFIAGFTTLAQQPVVLH